MYLPLTYPVEGVYEYWGIQRVGKTTVMVRDILMLNEYSGYAWDEFYTNFKVFIPGVHCMNSQALMETILQTMKDKIPHRVFVFDELGQFLGARNYRDLYQTKIANSLWQFPKRDLIFMYSDNVGNSADIVIRLATWEVIAPRFYSGKTRDKDYIIVDVIKNYMCETVRGIVIPEVNYYQRLFDTRQPID